MRVVFILPDSAHTGGQSPTDHLHTWSFALPKAYSRRPPPLKHYLQTLDDFTANPDVVEEFFYLVGRFIDYCPEPLVSRYA